MIYLIILFSAKCPNQSKRSRDIQNLLLLYQVIYSLPKRQNNLWISISILALATSDPFNLDSDSYLSLLVRMMKFRLNVVVINST